MLVKCVMLPQVHGLWTSRGCGAECISEGLGDHLAHFSWQPTHHSGMDAEVHSRAGVTGSSQPSCSTQVYFGTPPHAARGAVGNCSFHFDWMFADHHIA